MELTEEQQLTILDAVRAKSDGRTLTCPVSGDNDWQIQNRLAYLLADANIVGKSQLFPSVVMLCKSCGYTILLNVLVLGIADQLDLQGSKEQLNSDG